MSASDSDTAFKTFQLNNNIQEDDSIYKYDNAEHERNLDESPWTKDVEHYKHVKISALALLKMVMHARSGGNLEVMGLMQGKVQGDTMIIMDAFALPVEGTETRVSAHEQAYNYMIEYQELIKKVGRLENVLGWYHSHPGYGCWLSGIDVSTQMLNQQHQDPFLAVVIDPTRTMSAGKVELGAFRCYPQGYKAENDSQSEYQTIPLDKIEDFGVHSKQYYPLLVSYFKSSLDRHLLDLLWNKYWVSTLSSSPLYANADYTTRQIGDLTDKLQQAEHQLSFGNKAASYMLPESKREESQLAKCSRDGSKAAIETTHNLVSHVLKTLVFDSKRPSA